MNSPRHTDASEMAVTEWAALRFNDLRKHGVLVTSMSLQVVRANGTTSAAWHLVAGDTCAVNHATIDGAVAELKERLAEDAAAQAERAEQRKEAAILAMQMEGQPS